MNVRLRLVVIVVVLLFAGPASARFLSVDPVTVDDHGDMRHFNLYTYAYNNPYTFTDPDGRCPNCVMGLVGAGLGAGYGVATEGYRQFQNRKFDLPTLLIEGGKGAVVGGAIGLTGGAAGSLTVPAQFAATGSVGLGVGIGAHAAGEFLKGNPVPSDAALLQAGIATAFGGATGNATTPMFRNLTTTLIPEVLSHPVTSLGGNTFHLVNIPAQVIERPLLSAAASGAAGAMIEEAVKQEQTR